MNGCRRIAAACKVAAQQPQQDLVFGGRVLGVPLEAVALEPLRAVDAAVRRADLQHLRAERVAELRKAAMRLPVRQEAMLVRQCHARLREGNALLFLRFSLTCGQ